MSISLTHGNSVGFPKEVKGNPMRVRMFALENPAMEALMQEDILSTPIGEDLKGRSFRGDGHCGN